MRCTSNMYVPILLPAEPNNDITVARIAVPLRVDTETRLLYTAQCNVSVRIDYNTDKIDSLHLRFL